MYTIKVTENKRKLIFNENNKLIKTEPLNIDESKLIKKTQN